MPLLKTGLRLTAALLASLAASSARAQDCAPASTTVRIEASVSGSDTMTVRYTVVNGASDTLRWIRIGAGSEENRTVAVQTQTPVITDTPPGWRAMVVYPEETAYVHLWWETVGTRGGIAPGSAAHAFAVRSPGPGAVPQGQVGPYGPVHPIDFATLPFTVGGSHGACWWGRVTLAP